MKRIFFFTSVIIASALALYFLFSSPAKTSFIIDESFTSQILSSNKRAGQDAPILLQKNGPLDRILSKTASGNLLLTSSLSWSFSYEAWSIKKSWVFVFAFFDPIKLNTLEGDDYRITPITPGVLSVITNGNWLAQITSHNAVLRVDITTSSRRRITKNKSTVPQSNKSVVSTFLLLPGISFDLESKLIPTITSTKESGDQADILRLYALFRFRFIDPTRPDEDVQFLTKNLHDDWLHLTEQMTKELRILQWSYRTAWADIVNDMGTSSPTDVWGEKSSWLTLNQAKITQDRIVSFSRSLITMLSKKSGDTLQIRTLQEIYHRILQDDISRENIKNILRTISVLEVFAASSPDDNDSSSGHLSLNDLGLMPPRPNEISPGLADFLNNFSEFFLARILREKDLTTDETSEQISDYFDRLDLKKTSHIRSEYFSLVLFLVEYSRHLISKNDELNPLYFKIIAHLFGIGNALAEATPKWEGAKINVDTESMFVFYARLFDSINSTIAKYFFEDRQENSLLQLKDRFLDAMNNADFGTSKTIRDAYIHAVLCLNNYGGTSTKDTSCLKSVIDANRSLYTKISRDSPANADKYIKLNEIYLHNVETSNALLDYKTYSQPINAWSGVLVSLGSQAWKDETIAIKAYLASFSGLTPDTLIVSSGSSPETYHIRADFGSSRFTFEINPRDGHAISNIIIDDTTSYKDAYIRLDEKEKILREKCQNKTDESGCDFRQYFLVTFRNNYTNTTTMISDQTCSREWINEENRNFVQYNLLEKDFKNFNELMPIGFSNICDLQVINKEQILSLSKIPFPLKNVKNITYNALLEGKYTFQSHSFSDLTLLLISTQNTSWEPVLRIKFAQDIFPISDAATLHTFVDFITKMGNYVETLLSQGPSSNSVITFDTTNKTLSIDGVVIPVNESATR